MLCYPKILNVIFISLKLGRDTMGIKSPWRVTLLIPILLITPLMVIFPLVFNAQGQQIALIAVEPAHYVVPNVDVTFNINVTIQNVQNLYGWELKLYYPNDILNGTAVVEGYFLKKDDVSTFFRVHEFTDNYNGTHGRVWAYCTRIGNVSGVNGNGTLLSITFKSKAVNGPKNLTLDDVKLSDPEANKIECTIAASQIKVIPEISVYNILVCIILSAVLLSLFKLRNFRKC